MNVGEGRTAAIRWRRPPNADLNAWDGRWNLSDEALGDFVAKIDNNDVGGLERFRDASEIGERHDADLGGRKRSRMLPMGAEVCDENDEFAEAGERTYSLLDVIAADARVNERA